MGLIILVLCSFFLIYKYLLQVSPSVMTGELMHSLQLDGTTLGFLAAGFFYAYFAVQLISGPLLDRFNARYITAIALLSCAAGALLFAHSHDFTMAFVARLFMGAGAAFATVSYLRLTADYFSPKQYAIVTGFLTFPVMIGALMGQTPLAYLVDSFGWQDSLYGWGVFGIILALCFAVLIKSSNSCSDDSVLPSFQDYKKLFTNPRTWLLTLYSGLAFSPLAVFGGLWGDPFLQTAYHFSKTEAASLTSFAFIGFGVGGTLLGWLSNRFADRYGFMALGISLSLVSLVLVTYCNWHSSFYVALLLFIFGLGTSGIMLGFVVGKECNPLFLAATVIALINSGDALFGACTEPLIGKVLDQLAGTTQGSLNFNVHDYHMAFSLLPMYLVSALLALAWVKYSDSSSVHTTSYFYSGQGKG